MKDTLMFHIERIEGNIAIGAIKELSREPRREDYFIETGETEFGHTYVPTGYFNDSAFKNAKILWEFQSYPIGKYKERKVEIPDNIKVKPGQFIKVKYEGALEKDWLIPVVLLFHKDKVFNFSGKEKSVIKEFKTFEEEKKSRKCF